MPAPALLDELRAGLRGEIRAGEPMSRHTTWRVGGPADLFLVPADLEDARRALELLQRSGTPWLAVGAGSNLLVLDGGIRGAVIHTGRLRRMEIGRDGTVSAEAGTAVMTLLREAVAAGLEGLEGLAGIPGTVGGAAAMNAGAGGQEIGRAVRTLTVADGERVETWPAQRLTWGYRSSGLPAGWMILEVELKLGEGDPGALARTLRERLAQRRRTQGVGGPSAGSVFRNPPGRTAWRLIDEAGLRGAVQGGARVSELHANFIVSEPGGRAREILDLMARVREAVLRRSGIELEPEVRIVGEDRRAHGAAGGRMAEHDA